MLCPACKKKIEEMMPKEKQGIKFHSGRLNSELSPYSPKDNQKIGFNQCLKELNSKLTEEKG